MGKVENSGYQYFLLFQQWFQVFSHRVNKPQDRSVQGETKSE